MFTSLDKALAAVVMAILFILKTYFNIDLGLSTETVASIAMLLTALFVWAVPNKPKA